MERGVFERMAANQDRHWWFAARREVLGALVTSLPRPRTILEVGCGTGANLGLLSQHGTVTGVELDDEARATAQAAYPSLRLLAGALPGGLPPLGPEPFDLVCLFDVLEHIEDDVAALRALRPLVARTGHLLVTVPAYAWLFGEHDRRHHHKRRYASGQLAKVARRAGFSVVREGHFNTLLFPLAVAQRAAAALGPAGKESDAIPPPLVNESLRRVFALERFVVPRVRLPWGLSMWALLQPGDAA